MSDYTSFMQAAFDGYAYELVAEATAPLNNQINQLSSTVTKANADLATLQSKYNLDEDIITTLRTQLAQASLPSLPVGFTKTLFVDTFDGDLSKWNVQDKTTQNNTYCVNLKKNVSIRNGQLVITGLQEVTTSTTGRVCQYSSGYLDTINRFSFGPPVADTYCVEIRAKLPTPVGTSTGIWPAGWLRCNDTLGEFDIFEAWGEPVVSKSGEIYRSGSFSSSAYADTNDPSKGKVSNWGTPVGAPPIANDFHTWKWTWDYYGMNCYLDNSTVPYLTVPYTLPWYPAAFHSPMNLHLNLQIGSAWWGMPSSTTKWPAEFIVDYVRVSSK